MRVFPSTAPEPNLAARKQPDRRPHPPPPAPALGVLRWAGRPTVGKKACLKQRARRVQASRERAKKGLWWDGTEMEGYDRPDFAAKQGRRGRRPRRTRRARRALGERGYHEADGVGWLYVPSGLVHGPACPPLRARGSRPWRTRCTASSRARSSSMKARRQALAPT